MKVIVCSLVTAVVLLAVSTAWATPCLVSVYVDAAPNATSGAKSAYDAWEAAAFAAAANGKFVNMANSYNPANAGTTDFEIQDEVVYSIGDFGKRLHWIYWIPDTTIAVLTGNFKVALYNDWGTYPTEDIWGWVEPTKWIDYEDGVIGTFGMAYWAAYGVDTQEAVDADMLAWGSVPETWTFKTDLFDNQCGGLVSHREAIPVPEPVTMVALTSALIGLGGYVRRRTVA